jgi:hypothetical protein
MASGQTVVSSATPRRGFFGRLWLALRQLFHEVTGALFLLMAISFISSALRIWQRGAGPWLWGLSGGFAVLMVFFGVTSLVASRRVR